LLLGVAERSRARPRHDPGGPSAPRVARTPRVARVEEEYRHPGHRRQGKDGAWGGPDRSRVDAGADPAPTEQRLPQQPERIPGRAKRLDSDDPLQRPGQRVPHAGWAMDARRPEAEMRQDLLDHVGISRRGLSPANHGASPRPPATGESDIRAGFGVPPPGGVQIALSPVISPQSSQRAPGREDPDPGLGRDSSP
jgi:hypothetical protein